ncbi:MAG TPA: hypothetical protein DEP28_11075 [Bacteroidetes bacterium]|nr:BamA/TamA family outer membrane protein [Ignavibacteria bacterium]HCA43779.1 hypothetical protein [Bacteroidota bacterium]
MNFRDASNFDTTNFNLFPKKINNKKIGLVLSGGGARGISQIGILEVLEKNNIEPELIVGTSIGSLVGGLKSSGYNSKEISNLFKKTNWPNVLKLTNTASRENLYFEQKKIQDKSLISLSLDGFKPILPSSLSNGQSILDIINVEILNSRYNTKNNFSDLKYPFISVATNIDNGNSEVLTEGNLSEAIKASITFPLLYSPTFFNGKNLVDGGLTANIPVQQALDYGMDFTIVVNSTSPLKTSKELINPLNTADQILSITMDKLNDLQISKAGFVFTPDIGNYSSTDYSKIDYLINKGREEAENKITELLLKLDSLEYYSSAYFNNFVINPQIILQGISEIDDGIYSLINKKDIVRYSDVEKVLKFLYKTGNYANVFAEISNVNSQAIINITGIPNPELNSIIIYNNPGINDSLIINFENKYVNNSLNSVDNLKLYDDLLGDIRSKGLSYIEITKFIYDYNSRNILIYFSNGKVNEIEINGNYRTNNSFIERELKVSENKIITKADIEQSIKNLSSTNLFSQVSLYFIEDNEKKKLTLNLIEKNTRNIRLAIRSDNERNFQGLIDIRDENFLGSGNEIGISGSGSLRNREFKAEFRSNRFFDTYLTYNLTGLYSFNDVNTYKEVINESRGEFVRERTGTYRDIKKGLRFLLGSQLEKLGILYSQLIYEFYNLNTISGEEILSDNLRIIKLKFGTLIDSQDKIPFPNEGSLLNLYYETSQDNLGSNVSYSKIFINYEQYIPIGNRFTLKPRFIFGFADRTTPFQEQFSLGGETSFYGMVEDQLRGRQKLETSLELRYMLPIKIFFDTFLKFRYDLGRVWENAEDIRFKDLRHGIGMSISFDSPIGEASFSVGRTFLVNKGFTDKSFIFGPYTFYYSIGYDL